MSGRLGQVVERIVAAISNGFAFVELLVLAAMFSIVAAFAVPRISALDDEARSASIRALAADVRVTSALAHTVWLSEGQPQWIELRGQTVGLVYGYPDLASIDTAVGLDPKFDYDVARGVFSPAAGYADADCRVIYSVPSDWGQAPAVAILTGGC